MYDKLYFSNPSDDWFSGVPVGNGQTGFMHYGNPGHEIFAFNHDGLFRTKNKKTVKTAHIIQDMRKLMKEDKCKKAEELFKKEVEGLPRDCNPYQPFFDLKFELLGEEFKNYQKELDMKNALLHINYTLDDKNIKWEAFSNHPHNVNVILLSCDEHLSCHIISDREEDEECSFKNVHQGNTLYFDAEFCEGVLFCAGVKILTDGTLTQTQDGFIASDFKNLCVYTVLNTGENSFEKSKKDLACIPDYEILLKSHIADFESLYKRFSLTLDTCEIDSETAYKRAMENDITESVYGYFLNMARYAMISSSRDTNPINLQGIWNHNIKPDWDCGYTTDINIQMSYWPSEVLNLSSCEKPLFSWILKSENIMKTQAKNIFGVEDGVYVPQFTDLFMTPACWIEYAPFQILWSGSAAWISQHFFTYWKHSGDDEFIKTKGYPFMKKCANFYIEFLTLDENGKYELVPAANPENWTKRGELIVNTSAMDLWLIHELMQNLMHINESLNLEDKDAAKWKDIDSNLKDYYVYEDGALSEFTDGSVELDPGHRHLSHIYALFPGNLCKKDEKLKKACCLAIERRLASGLLGMSGWALAWYACCFSAMGDGNRALEFVTHVIRGCLMPNYLTTHNDWRENSGYCYGRKIFQIDSLFGLARAIANMFISCDNEVTHILPALPDKFKSGTVCGICGFKAFSYDIVWKENALKELTVYANKGGSITLELKTDNIKSTHFFKKEGRLYTFENLKENEIIKITV